MNTVISKLYLDKIKDLAEKFAKSHCIQNIESKEYQVSYRKTYNNYYEISVFLYIRLNKISRNTVNWNFNRIPCTLLRKFTCKLYKKILDDLIENQIIVRNDHYSDFSNNKFCKSFLIHRSLLNKIRKTKEKLNYQLETIEVPKKVLDLLGDATIENNDDFLFENNILNKCYEGKEQEKDQSTINHYSELQFDKNQLEQYTETDEFAYNRLLKDMKKLKNKPKFIKGRFYHIFHQLSKNFREKVLLLDNEHITEIFDVHGSDLHMLAKILEDPAFNIPKIEIEKFQREVKEDFRKKFGVKRNGKCTAYVKRAFKVYLNNKKSSYRRIRPDSIVGRIDEYFDVHFPTIRNYIRNTDDIWLHTMNKEFEVISVNMIKELNKKGIKALSCHDSIYVKNSDVEIKKEIEDIFYDSLNFRINEQDKLFNL